MSLDLGAMVDDGILAENPALLSRVLAYGTLDGITRERFHNILDYYCQRDLPVLSPHESQIAIGLGSGGGDGLESVDYSRQPMLLSLTASSSASSGTQHGTRTRARERFVTTKASDDAAEIVTQAIVEKLSASLAAFQDRGSVDLDKQLQLYGVDSLLAVELRNWIVKEFAAHVAVFETQGAATLTTLSMLVVQRSTLR